MYKFKTMHAVNFSVCLAIFLMSISLHLVKVRDLTGYAVTETTVDKAGLLGIFLGISLIVSFMVFLIIMFRASSYSSL